MFFHREKKVRFHITIFELKPPAKGRFCLLGEEHSSVLSALGFFCSEAYPPSGQVNVRNQKGGAFAQTHSTVQHQQNHHIITMFSEIGLVHLGKQFLQIIVRQEHLGLSVVLQLSDLSHGVLSDDVVPFEPVEEHTQIANVIVDGGNADRFAIVPSAFGVVLFLRLIVDIEGVTYNELLEEIYNVGNS